MERCPTSGITNLSTRALLVLLLAVTAATQPLAALAQTPAVPETTIVGENWLEPRGLSVLNLVGLVPDEHLRGATVSAGGAVGLLTYMAGNRTGDLVTVRVSVSPRYTSAGYTVMGSMGQSAANDDWPINVPASELRIFSYGQDITANVFGVQYYRAGKLKPTWGTEAKRDQPHTYTRYEGYWVADEPVVRTPDGAIKVPANMGCIIFVAGHVEAMEAEFRYRLENKIGVRFLDSKQFVFRSYIGPGYAGILASLQKQMSNRFGRRHDKFPIVPPAEADYMLVKFPQTPVNPSPLGVEANIQLPTSGTYRLADGHSGLATDHKASVGLPIHVQWLDSDIDGDEYLQPLKKVDTLTSPEFFVPTGIEYDPCMTDGGCPDTLLQQIYDATMSMTVYYYSIQRVGDGLEQIPLRQVGPDWRPGLATASSAPVGADTLSPGPTTVFLPLVSAPLNLPKDDPQGCPCGWFDSDGQMLDVVPTVLREDSS